MSAASAIDSNDLLPQMLASARGGGSEALGQLLQVYRNYLSVLATAQLDRRIHRRLDPSDLVQETMLAAHRDFADFRGGSERELLGWLRQILINCLRTAIDIHVRAKKRDLRREISIERLSDSLDRGIGTLNIDLVDRGPSPSTPAQQRERAVQVADQLSKLRPEYRDVIIYRNLQGLSFNEIAEQMQRKPGTVRMLWLRAMDKFKETYELDG